MNDIEGRLPALLDRAAGNPPRSIDVPSVHRRAHRQRVAIASLTAGALAPLAALAVALPLTLTGGGSPKPGAVLSQVPTPNATSTTTTQLATCQATAMRIRIISGSGAAGTHRWVVQAMNPSTSACVTGGYPGMDFHTATGWLNTQVHRGGYPDINGAASTHTVNAGGSVYFVAYYSDATTSAGNCRTFNDIKVTLPNNYNSAVVAAAGCVTPSHVYVGPMTTSRPSP